MENNIKKFKEGKPLVSVHMVTYNHSKFIKNAIEGVLKQKANFPIELIIGEDCSSDGTREIVLRYQKNYPDIIKVITSKNNVGAKKNARRVRKACIGKYIAWCDGDDYWHNPNKLQKQVTILESNNRCGLVYSDYDVWYVRSDRRIKNYSKYRNWEIPQYPDIYDFLKGKGGILAGILTCTVIARRSLVEQIIDSDPTLYDNSKFLMGDTQLWAEIAAVARVEHVPESLATYVVSGESASQSKDIKKRLRFLVSASELLIYLCDKYNASSSIKNIHTKNFFNYSLKLAFYSRNATLADEIKQKKIKLQWVEWLYFYGAKNVLVYRICRLVILLRAIFRKEYIEWT